MFLKSWYSFNIEPTTHESMPNSVAQDQPRYYVDMLIVSIITNLEYVSLIENLVETLEQSSAMWE
jgi:hypothetical protein